MNVWLLLLTLAVPPDVQSDFTAANDRALQGDLRGAIALYESLYERGIHNPDVLFNLGNAYAKNDQPLDAVIAYERALRLSPGDEDILANLSLVRNRLSSDGTNDIETPEAPLSAADAFAPWVAVVPPFLVALALLIGNALFWWGLWVPARRWTFVSVGGGLAAVAAILLIAHAVVAGDDVAVVKQPTPLREGPRPQFREAGTLPIGARVRIIDTDGSWREVQRDDGTTGWLRLKDIVPL
ncbi:MAG: tetratricopeptide repeat protein [Myxococcota bacterium]